MMPHPLVSLYTNSIHSYTPISLVEDFIQDIPDLVRVRFYDNGSTRSPAWIFDFEAETDPWASMGISQASPYIVIDHQQHQVTTTTNPTFVKAEIVFTAESQASISEPSMSPAPRRQFDLKKFKLNESGSLGVTCYICHEEIHPPFSTPCWECKHAQCYDCTLIQFRTALSDFERFPARCCSVFHPDVAKGILPDHEYSKYRLRFEEWLVKDQKVYCPVPTCSAFMPTRLIRPKSDGDFECFECHTSICTKCKQKSHIPLMCEETDSQTEMKAIMQKFDYKQCPRCKSMVAKMFGCSHIKCRCGAHWCFECSRRQDVCNSRPCSGRDADYADYEYENEYHGIDQDQLSDIDTPDFTDQGTATADSEQGSEDINVGNASTTDLAMLIRSDDAKDTQQADTDLMDTTEDDSRLVLKYDQDNIGDIQQPVNEQTTDEDTVMTGTSPIQSNTFGVDRMSINHLITPTPAETDSAQATNQLSNYRARTPPLEDAIENLDGPAVLNWEFQDRYFFGEEPDEDDELDMWGCVHKFQPATHHQVPRYWKTASAPDWWERDVNKQEIDCMVCWQPTKVALTQQEIDAIEDEGEKSKTVKDWRYLRRCWKCNILVCRKCRNDLVKDMK